MLAVNIPVSIKELLEISESRGRRELVLEMSNSNVLKYLKSFLDYTFIPFISVKYVFSKMYNLFSNNKSFLG